MRYGGHQTFTIREGWLHKGMQFLMSESEEDRNKLVDDYAADYLGVGRNMAKSINHWLIATGLAVKKTEPGKNGKLKDTKYLIPNPNEFPDAIWKKDPYFLDAGTWWMIHINMVNSYNDAATWGWFFNNFHLDRFQKQVCLQSLIRYESLQSGRNPSETTLDRDLSCFLNSYSKEIPSKKKDPEDEIESPLVELNLMNYYRSSGYFQVQRDKKNINMYLFLYALQKSMEFQGITYKQDYIELPFFDLVKLENGPGRVFALSNEGLFELLLEYEKESQAKIIRLIGLAGDRLVKFPNKTSIHWAHEYYKEGAN
jgi:hypothetical protein